MEIRIPLQYASTKYILPLSPLYEPPEPLEEDDRTPTALRVEQKQRQDDFDAVSFVWPDSPTTELSFESESTDVRPTNRMAKLFQNPFKSVIEEQASEHPTLNTHLTRGRPRALTLPQHDQVLRGKGLAIDISDDTLRAPAPFRQRSSSIPSHGSTASLPATRSPNGGDVLRGLAAAKERAKQAKLCKVGSDIDTINDNTLERKLPLRFVLTFRDNAARRRKLPARRHFLTHRHPVFTAARSSSLKLQSAVENDISSSNTDNGQKLVRERSDSSLRKRTSTPMQDRKFLSPVQPLFQEDDPKTASIPDKVPTRSPVCGKQCTAQLESNDVNLTESHLPNNQAALPRQGNRRYQDRRTSRVVQPESFQINVTVPAKRKETKLERIFDKSTSLLAKRSREKIPKAERPENSGTGDQQHADGAHGPVNTNQCGSCCDGQHHEESDAGPRSASHMSNYSRSEISDILAPSCSPTRQEDHMKSFIPEIMVDIHNSTVFLDHLLSEQEPEKLFPLLPIGVLASNAVQNYSSATVSSLVHHAREEAKNFAVLDPGEVEKLCEALANIEKKEEVLRNAYASFRQNRSALLQVRLLHYLRSPMQSQLDGDSLLQQEIGLATLDSRADEWERRLEKMGKIRNEIREKLLGHLIGSLAMEYLHNRESQISTPPSSPQRLDADIVIIQAKTEPGCDMENEELGWKQTIKDMEEEIERLIEA
ncbi:hypothetical protein NEOLI_003426 [Neolecta irregularis DAH-3]|uniref:Up-regulated during septation protein 1 domain-containing protein n=1 Tax=Neolecta irregularis (strain DAH-3) TaxID=1198029 RepID=A0A1U7LTN6_NEOID|nr:hypothetical protein NEOLI_003426 [Neolecta irregularis DAH-3]|eukprot:OLL26030.1 hypothetical protein NEOLI_003426 [Neolecta irregularis DAH-3]